mmetsp:Transcript_8019/g.26270  ORF Transcript_8019/g.26270 Transcript_8019/m.26270 type:complete len:229 (+) Transcript_8019:2024-2710(+)
MVPAWTTTPPRSYVQSGLFFFTPANLRGPAAAPPRAESSCAPYGERSRTRGNSKRVLIFFCVIVARSNSKRFKCTSKCLGGARMRTAFDVRDDRSFGRHEYSTTSGATKARSASSKRSRSLTWTCKRKNFSSRRDFRAESCSATSSCSNVPPKASSMYDPAVFFSFFLPATAPSCASSRSTTASLSSCWNKEEMNSEASCCSRTSIGSPSQFLNAWQKARGETEEASR